VGFFQLQNETASNKTAYFLFLLPLIVIFKQGNLNLQCNSNVNLLKVVAR